MVKYVRNFFNTAGLFIGVILSLQAAVAAEKKLSPEEARAAFLRQLDEDLGPDEPPKMPEKFHRLEEGEIPLKADGAVVIDALTGEALYEKSADLRLFPASTTKIMTALLVIESGNLGATVEITVQDAKVGESSLQLKPGDRYTRQQMLYGLMLKSANDVAFALGRDNAGSMEAFAAKMTLRARELGAMNTRFMNPHGLHHVEHYTTARDLAIIARAAMQQPFFRRLVSTQRYQWVRPTDPPEVWNLSNHNRLLRDFDGCTGVKTGFTNPAKHTLVSAALRDHREVIAVVMHDGKNEKWEDSKLLLTYGLAHPAPAWRTAAAR